MAELSLLLLTFLWGTTFLAVKTALQDASTGVFLLLRLGVALVAVGALWAWRRKRDAPTPGVWWDGLRLGLAMWAGFALQTLGLRYTTPARSAFLTGLCVLFVPFLGLLLYRRRVAKSSWVGVILATVGLVAFFQDSISAEAQFGDLLTLGCAVAYTFQIVWAGEFAPRHHLTLLTLLQIAVTFLGSALLLPLEPIRLAPTAAFWPIVAFTGLVMTAGAFFIMNWGQRHTTAVRAALIYSLEPVVAALFSWYYGGEVLGPGQILGGALIVGGVLVGELGNALVARLRPTE